MSRKKSDDQPAKSGEHLPVLVDRRLLKALDHVLRQHILLAAVQEKVSPNQLSKLLGEGLSQVSYHVKVLYEDCDEVIELVGTEPRRGAVEHFYRASAKTLLPANAWRQVKSALRAVIGAGLASDLFNDLGEALNAGKLKGASDHIARTPLVLDTEGRRKVKAIAERATKEVEAEQQAAARRMANGDGDKAIAYTFGMLAFEAAWDPADLHAHAARSEADATPRGAGGNGNASGKGKRAKRRAKAAGK